MLSRDIYLKNEQFEEYLLKKLYKFKAKGIEDYVFIGCNTIDALFVYVQGKSA